MQVTYSVTRADVLYTMLHFLPDGLPFGLRVEDYEQWNTSFQF